MTTTSQPNNSTGEARIARDVAGAAARQHDLIVIGGGIYGVMTALEAARRGMRPVLVERGDFGSGVTWNWLRVVHGGLRYLQSLDLRRFFDSVKERRWFLQHMPDCVRTMPCLMPLYNQGLRRRPVMGAALTVDHLLSLSRNRDVPLSHRTPRGRTLGARATQDLFESVDTNGLKGAALWYDGKCINSQRLMMELCRWASASGATMLNYVEVTGALTEGDRLVGVRALDRTDNTEVELRAPVVVNTAGSRCAGVAEALGDARKNLFNPAIAFNLLIDRPPLSPAAVAVAPRYEGARTYFVHEEGGRMLAGTYHAPFPDGADAQTVLPPLIEAFVDDLNQAAPGLNLQREQVLRAYAGLLPAAHHGAAEPPKRPLLFDHGQSGGLDGLYSVGGVKLTTARLVAEQLLMRTIRWPNRRPEAQARTARPPAMTGPVTDELAADAVVDDALVASARAVMEEESVVRFADLMMRRTLWARDPDVGAALAAPLGRALGFDEQQIAACVDAIGRRPVARAGAQETQEKGQVRCAS